METKETLEETIFTVKRGPIDNKPRKLIVHPEFIQFESGNGTSNQYIKFDKTSIKAYRFGVKWIRGSHFTIGREYQIFISNKEDKILKINFKSFYGIKKKACHHLYVDILEKLWDYYFRDIANNFLHEFWDNQEFTICNVTFNKENLSFKTKGILKEETKEIEWDKVQTRDYQTYFAIYSTDDPVNKNKTFNYLNDWNTNILYSVVRTILKNYTPENS